MFTGIITDVGSILSISEDNNKFKISTLFDHSDIDIGASICCSGICLTVTEKGAMKMVPILMLMSLMKLYREQLQKTGKITAL